MNRLLELYLGSPIACNRVNPRHCPCERCLVGLRPWNDFPPPIVYSPASWRSRRPWCMIKSTLPKGLAMLHRISCLEYGVTYKRGRRSVRNGMQKGSGNRYKPVKQISRLNPKRCGMSKFMSQLTEACNNKFHAAVAAPLLTFVTQGDRTALAARRRR